MAKAKQKHKYTRKPIVTIVSDKQAADFDYAAIQKNRRQTSRRAPSNILQTAESLIYDVRNKTYRHPSENFENIANLWNAYFEAIKVRPEVMIRGIGTLNRDVNTPIWFKINKIDVAYMNILQKIARGATNQEHEDTIVDIAGYAGCIERIVKSK